MLWVLGNFIFSLINFYESYPIPPKLVHELVVKASSAIEWNLASSSVVLGWHLGLISLGAGQPPRPMPTFREPLYCMSAPFQSPKKTTVFSCFRNLQTLNNFHIHLQFSRNAMFIFQPLPPLPLTFWPCSSLYLHIKSNADLFYKNYCDYPSPCLSPSWVLYHFSLYQTFEQLWSILCDVCA